MLLSLCFSSWRVFFNCLFFILYIFLLLLFFLNNAYFVALFFCKLFYRKNGNQILESMVNTARDEAYKKRNIYFIFWQYPVGRLYYDILKGIKRYRYPSSLTCLIKTGLSDSSIENNKFSPSIIETPSIK